MKSNIFREVMEEITVEVNKSFSDTVMHFRSMQGKCRETDELGFPLSIYCNKKGKITVTNASNDKYGVRMYYVCGEIVAENGKTKVNIYSIHEKSYQFFYWLNFGLSLISSLLIFIVNLLTNSSIFLLTKTQIFLLAYFVLCIILKIFLNKKEKQNSTKDLEIMKNEIIKRIVAINCWND